MTQVDPITKRKLSDYDYKDIEYMAKVKLHVHEAVHALMVHAHMHCGIHVYMYFIHVTMSTIPKIASICVCLCTN